MRCIARRYYCGMDEALLAGIGVARMERRHKEVLWQTVMPIMAGRRGFSRPILLDQAASNESSGSRASASRQAACSNAT